MSRYALILGAALVAAAALFLVWFTRAERSASGIVDVPEEAPPAEARASELLAPPVLEPAEAVVELEDAHEPPSSRRVALPDEPVRARPGKTSVVPEPELARVTVKVVLPVGVPDSPEAWRSVDAVLSQYFDPHTDYFTEGRLVGAGSSYEAPRFSATRQIPDATRREDGGFEFDRVPAGVALDLKIEQPFGPMWARRLAPLAAGEQLEILAELDAGITVSGRVLDESGAPVQGARLSARRARTSGSEESVFESADESSITDASGSFLFEGLSRVDWMIQAHHHSISGSEEQLAAGSSGDVHGLVLSVKRGGSIEGTVTWADGRPATWSFVRVRGRGVSSNTTATDGTFLFRLPQGTYDIEVEAKEPGILGTARAEAVPTGGAPCDLVLERSETFELRGIVVDLEGAPVKRFTVSWRSVDGARKGSRAESKGVFVMDGLVPGELVIEIRADGYASPEQRVVVGGARSEPLRFALEPAGFVRGQVVDARGDPVLAAVVRTGDAHVSTRSDGRFEIRPTATRLSLSAAKPGHARSEPVELEVGPGAVVEGIVLRLCDSGQVIGRVLDPDGRGVAHAYVMAMRGRELLSDVLSDADGRFSLEDLPPGPAWISALPRQDSALRAEADVQVIAGETSEVELRLERVSSLPVRGRIERSGRPIACRILFRSGSSTEWGQSDSDGRLEAVLPRPGTWKGVLCLKGEALDFEHSDLRLFAVEVPDTGVPDLQLDFDALPRVRSLEELGD